MQQYQFCVTGCVVESRGSYFDRHANNLMNISVDVNLQNELFFC
jgi:hypothetical protein